MLAFEDEPVEENRLLCVAYSCRPLPISFILGGHRYRRAGPIGHDKKAFARQAHPSQPTHDVAYAVAPEVNWKKQLQHSKRIEASNECISGLAPPIQLRQQIEYVLCFVELSFLFPHEIQGTSRPNCSEGGRHGLSATRHDGSFSANKRTTKTHSLCKGETSIRYLRYACSSIEDDRAPVKDYKDSFVESNRGMPGMLYPAFDTGLRWPLRRSSDARKPLVHVGVPTVFFVAGAGFEPATFGL